MIHLEDIDDIDEFEAEQREKRKELLIKTYQQAKNRRAFYMVIAAIGLGLYYDWKIGLVAFFIWSVCEQISWHFDMKNLDRRGY